MAWCALSYRNEDVMESNWVGLLGSPGVGLLDQFPLFCYFLDICQNTIYIERHIHSWQGSPQSCGDTCQIWKWFEFPPPEWYLIHYHLKGMAVILNEWFACIFQWLISWAFSVKVTIGSCNCLRPWGNKQLPESVLIKVYVVTWCQQWQRVYMSTKIDFLSYWCGLDCINVANLNHALQCQMYMMMEWYWTIGVTLLSGCQSFYLSLFHKLEPGNIPGITLADPNSIILMYYFAGPSMCNIKCTC